MCVVDVRDFDIEPNGVEWVACGQGSSLSVGRDRDQIHVRTYIPLYPPKADD